MGGEYEACARQWFVSHPTDFDDRPEDGSASRTSVTIVPCSHDFETQVPAEVALSFQVVNEFEQSFSTTTRVNCWNELELSEDVNPIFSRDVLGGDWALSQIISAGNPPLGFTVVAQTVHLAGKSSAFSAAAVVAPQGQLATQADLIRIPTEVVP
jgi:hypothetical protein